MIASTHRWPRATIGSPDYGRLCDCGNLKTPQALTCSDCAVERRRAPGYWERRTCACGGPKSKDAVMCRSCADEAKCGIPVAGRPQPEEHPWRKAETLRLAA